MSDNLELWNALSKTDPRHTKPFNRSGGFKGTAIKPIWIIRQLTAQFGPCGVGWGMEKPQHEYVHVGDGEVLVYCTVSAWHGNKDNVLWGVGGDKAVTRRNDGKLFVDDEAAKKAFTDALNNAFKFVGVGGDIHMGMFEDDKYVTATKAEYAEVERAANAPPPDAKINDKTRDWITDKLTERQLSAIDLCGFLGVTSLKDLTYGNIDAVKEWLANPQQKAA